MDFDCPSWPPDWPEISEAISSSLVSGDWGRYHSPMCQAFQTRLQSLFGGGQVRLCCSGTAALELALRSAKVGVGDEVILAAYDYPGNLRTIELLGAKPVLLDVSPGRLVFDSEAIGAFASGHTSGQVKAVVVSHLFGEMADAMAVREVCEQNGWVLIEDVCQSFGAGWRFEEPACDQPSPDRAKVRLAGTVGHLSTFSFGGSKLLTAGAGGALLINDGPLAARINSWIERPGEVYPMSPLQAAVLGPQLDRFEELRALRNENWRQLRQHRCEAFSRWQWFGGNQAGIIANPYKIAWAAESKEQRMEIVRLAEQRGIPIGSGYRSFAKVSAKRCLKIGACEEAARLGERLFVLDQRALLVERGRMENLLAAMDSIYSELT